MHLLRGHQFRTSALCLLAGLMLGLQGCGPREAAPPAAAAPSAIPTAGVAPEVVPLGNPPPASQVQATVPKAAVPGTVSQAGQPQSAPGAVVVQAAPSVPSTPAPKPPTPVAVPSQPSSPVTDPGGEVAVKPAKAGLSRVGTSSCKMCHKVQFASWSESAHGKRNPPLDCESCHGAGSEYKAMATMKDPAKAAAAGLVIPTAAFCTTCHKRNWSDGMLKKAHAHKP